MTESEKEQALKISKDIFIMAKSGYSAVDIILEYDCRYWARDGVSGEEIMIDRGFWEEVKIQNDKLINA